MNLSQAKNSRHSFEQFKIFLYFLLTIVTALLITSPLLDFQPYLAQGDHGRDLYGYWMITQGKIPYHDFTLMFGPLMPYYYACFLKLFGISIHSVLLGQNILIIASAALIFSICRCFTSPFAAYCSTVLFLYTRGFEFFYTYNHTGAFATILLIVYFLFKFSETKHLTFFYLGFFSLTLLMLIRLNMGVALLCGYNFSIIIITLFQHKSWTKTIKHFLLANLTSILPVILIYYVLLKNLPYYIIQQSFPWGQVQRAETNQTIFYNLLTLYTSLVDFFLMHWRANILGLFFIVVVTHFIWFIKQNKLTLQNKIFFLILCLFNILTLHEFIASGVPYRMGWAHPIFLLICIFIASQLFKSNPHKHKTQNIHIIAFTIILVISCLGIKKYHALINEQISKKICLIYGPNQIYTSQPVQWFNTITSTLNYIDNNIPRDESIFVIPCDPLYLFLSQRKSPTREIMLFEHFNIPQEQEQNIIQTLEEKKVNWIIGSNRLFTTEAGMGIFGKTYCQTLAEYINNNFEAVSHYGEWNSAPSWADNHGIYIFKRVHSKPKQPDFKTLLSIGIRD